MSKSTSFRVATLVAAIFLLTVLLSCSEDNPQSPEPEPTHDFELTATLSADGIHLNWVQIGIAGSAGYYVYRTEDTTAGFSAIDTLAVDVTEFVDCDIETGSTYHYCLAAFDGNHQETCTSETRHVAVSSSTLVLSATAWDCPWGGGTSEQINVANMCSAPITGWSAAENNDWLTVQTTGISPTGFTMDADTNFGGLSRTGTVQVNSPDHGTRSLTVQQVALFDVPAYSTTVLTPVFVCTGRFNGDDACDLAVANDENDGVTVLLNEGEGTFPQATFYPVGEEVSQVVSSDVNGDGYQDLIVRCYMEPDIFVLTNNGDGTFGQAAAQESWDYSLNVVAGDFDGDGDNDIVLVYYTNEIGVLLNDGEGTFSAPVVMDAQSGISVVVSDLDGDADLDIISANPSLGIAILLNDGDAGFSLGATYPDEEGVGAIDCADLDGDGDSDIIATNPYYELVTVMLNNGSGEFPSITDISSVGPLPWALVCGDYDGDSDVDVAFAVGGDSGNMQILRNNGDATFAATMTLSIAYKAQSICTDDLDGDLDTDIVGVDNDLSQVIILKNNLH